MRDGRAGGRSGEESGAEGCPRPGRNWNQSSSRGDGAAEGRGAVCLGVRGIAASQNGGVLIQRSSFGDPGAQLPSVLQRSSGVQASMVMVGCRASPLSMPLDVLWSELPLLQLLWVRWLLSKESLKGDCWFIVHIKGLYKLRIQLEAVLPQMVPASQPGDMQRVGAAALLTLCLTS